MEEEEFIPEAENETPEAALKKLRQKLKICLAEKQEYLNMSQRLRADYLNYKREVEAARETVVQFARESLLLELIALADSFEAAFADRENWQQTPEIWRRGVENIHSQLLALFQRHDLEPLDPLGEPFNPVEHQSVGAVEVTLDKDDNMVMSVVRKGYRLRDRLLRPAQVKVGQLRSEKRE